MNKNTKLSKHFPGEGSDTDEKLFRTKIWGYVQNKSDEDFRAFLLKVIQEKPKRTTATIIHEGTHTDIPADIRYLAFKQRQWVLHDDFYAWASDVKGQLQQLFNSKNL